MLRRRIKPVFSGLEKAENQDFRLTASDLHKTQCKITDFAKNRPKES